MTWEQEPDYDEARPYWPDFVEEDYRVVVGMVGRFALYTGVPDFTLGQLEGHLLRLNVELVGESDWPTLFAEMREDIISDLAEQGRQFQWAQRRIGRRVLYSLVAVGSELTGPEQESSLAGAAPVEDAQQEHVTQSVAESGTEQAVPDTRLDELFLGLPDRQVRTKELPGLLTRRFGVDEPVARDMIHAARAEGRLHKRSVGGVAYVSLDPPPESARSRRRVASHAEAEDRARELNETEIAAATLIMDTLAASGTHVSEGRTIKRLEHELNLGLSYGELRKLLRHMQSMRLISIDSSGNYGQARKSSRVRIRGQDMKSRWVGNKNGYIGKLRNSRVVG